MKKIVKKSFIIILILLTLVSVAYAGATVPFFYNVLPTINNNAIIDSNSQNKLTFKLYENEGDIYYNNSLVNVTDNKFEIDISNLTGKQIFTFTNASNETVNFTYYISDKNGFVEGTTYVTTVDNIKLIYTEKEAKIVEKISEYIKSMPGAMKANVKEIILLPYKSASGATGVTVYNKIVLYNISKYSLKTIQNVIYHEIAHTWAYDLMRNKLIDYSYTNYKEVVNKDNNYVSSYSKKYITEKNNYSEDFADGVAFYLMNTSSFSRKYPERSKYIESLIK